MGSQAPLLFSEAVLRSFFRLSSLHFLSPAFQAPGAAFVLPDQFLLQLFQGSSVFGTDGAVVPAQKPGNLVPFITSKNGQYHNQTLFFTQNLQKLQRLCLCHQTAPVCLLYLLRFLHRKLSAPSFFQALFAAVDQNTEDPETERSLLFQAAKMLIRRQRRILHRILCIFGISHIIIGQTIQIAVYRLIQLHKSFHSSTSPLRFHDGNACLNNTEPREPKNVAENTKSVKPLTLQQALHFFIFCLSVHDLMKSSVILHCVLQPLSRGHRFCPALFPSAPLLIDSASLPAYNFQTATGYFCP